VVILTVNNPRALYEELVVAKHSKQ